MKLSFETGNASSALVPVYLRVLHIVTLQNTSSKTKTKQGELQNNKTKQLVEFMEIEADAPEEPA